jgi:hypothetical protein
MIERLRWAISPQCLKVLGGRCECIFAAEAIIGRWVSLAEKSFSSHRIIRISMRRGTQN